MMPCEWTLEWARKVSGVIIEGHFRSARIDHGCALRCGGEVAHRGAAGRRGDGVVIGLGDAFNPMAPPAIGLNNVVELESSLGATCALEADSNLYCWGLITNFTNIVFAGLGQSASGERYLVPNLIPGTHHTTQVVLGGLVERQNERLFGNLCVLDRCGDVYCMGRNELGQLGDGTTRDSLAFTQVLGLP